jgi:threonine/homoserine/homoserine lactone efflux protein
MTILINFCAAFFFSLVGTIPPGTLNINILQLGLERKISLAWRFAIAASIVEYPYAWIAIKFENLITSTPVILENIQLITAIVMIVLGITTLVSARKPSKLSEKFNNSGFRRGLILSILNPLALPFWIGTTAYLIGQRWIDLNSPWHLHSYLIGVSLGALTLFMTIAYLAQYVVKFINESIIKVVPGVILLVLGLYAFIRYLT